MMKKIILGICIFGITALGFSQITNEHKSFQPGEKLSFLMSYGLIKGGTAAIEVNSHPTDSINLLHINLFAKTLGLTDKIYKVSDTLDSYFDPNTFLPVTASQKINEGKFHRLYQYKYDHVSREDSSIVLSNRKGVQVMPKYVMDILSGLYKIRELNINDQLDDAQIFQVDTYYNDKHFPFILRYKGKESIKTPLGKIDCYAFMPVTIVGRVFESNDALTIYFSADKNKIPVSFEFDMFFGKAKCELIEYEGLLNEFESLTPKEIK